MIAGATKPEQVTANARAAEWQHSSAEEMAEIRRSALSRTVLGWAARHNGTRRLLSLR